MDAFGCWRAAEEPLSWKRLSIRDTVLRTSTTVRFSDRHDHHPPRSLRTDTSVGCHSRWRIVIRDGGMYPRGFAGRIPSWETVLSVTVSPTLAACRAEPNPPATLQSDIGARS